MKKILSIILAILMVVTMLPMAAYAATSGSCGDGVYFTIKNGTLTITGSGAVMKQAASACWSKERPNIKKIVIGNGITLPNSFACYGHSDLTTVEYGNTVATIGFGAFNSCNNITSFTLREGVGMSDNAFAGARKLTGASVKLVDASGNDKSSFYTVTVESNTSNRNYMTVKGNLAKGYIADIPAQDHTGEEVKPAVEVIWNGQTVSSSNYDVTYSNNIELGTATVTVKGKDANYYTGTLTQTFEIKPHVHDWSNKDGICAGGCGLECAHESFTDGVCTTCGYACVHNNIVDSKCLVCGLTGKFIAINMYDYYGDGWLGNEIIISKLLADGSSETIGTATLEDGEEGTYRLIVGTDDIFTLTWNAADYSGDCTFTVDVDGKNVFESKTCNNYEDGEVVYTYCDHTFENGVCTACDHVCLHKYIADDSCLDCYLSLKNVTINMHDGYGDGWTGAHIIISKLLADGSFREIGLATLENIENGVYDFPIAESDIYSLKWQSGTKDYDCTFEVLVDGETVFESKTCDNYKDGEIVYINCEHTFENGVCTVCGIPCTHINFSGNKCLDCGLTGKFVTILMYDSDDDGWTGADIIISKLLAGGSSAEISTATLENGEEGTYSFLIAENSGFTLKWNSSYFDDECTFKVLVDGETVFESKSCDNYDDDEVVYTYCVHSFENYICTVCGAACTHKNIAGGKCLDCGLTGKFVTILMYDSYGDGWDGANVIISKLLADGSSEEIGTATILNGEEGSYNFYIGENDVFALKWEKGSYDDECTFEVLVDDETVFESKSCDNYDDGEVVYTYCVHSFENGVCAVCGAACTHKNIAGGKCLDCGLTGTFVTILMYDSYGDDWNGANVIISKLLADGSSEAIGTATIHNGEESSYNFCIGENDAFALKWEKGSYDDECTFKVLVDDETVFESKSCNNYDDGEVVYTYCGHSFENGVCAVCGYKCDHDWSNLDGVCASGCGFVCAHENVTDATCVTSALCDVCGLEVYDLTNHEGEYVTVRYNDYQHVSEYECCHIGSSIVYGDHDYKDYTVTTPADCVNNAWETGTCICGDTHVREIADSATDHNWSNKDGICANGCGETCPHESYIGGVCDKCAYECPHEWGEGVLTRPTFETAGYYTYTCTLCGNSYTEPTKRADDTALNDASMKVMEYIGNDTLTQEAKDEIDKSYRDILKNNGNIFNELGFVRDELIEEDQPIIDAITAEFEKIIADAEEKIASGEYVKADYTEIDEAIKAVEDKLADKNITDEGKAGLEEIKKQLEEMKADENTSEADLAELEKALEDYEAELDKGIEDGTLVMFRAEKFGAELLDEWKEKLEAEGLLDEYEDFINNQKATDEALAAEKAVNDFMASLEGTVAENAENIAKLNEMNNSICASFENCLRGTHNFNDYEVTSPAKCGENAIETRTCWFCGETDEREVEGTALTHKALSAVIENEVAPKCEAEGSYDLVVYCELCGDELSRDTETIDALGHSYSDYVSNGDATCTSDGTMTAECDNGCGEKDTTSEVGSKLEHTDEDGDKVCDDCSTEIVDMCPDCGRPVHEETGIPQYICIIIMLIRLVVSFLNSVR